MSEKKEQLMRDMGRDEERNPIARGGEDGRAKYGRTKKSSTQ